MTDETREPRDDTTGERCPTCKGAGTVPAVADQAFTRWRCRTCGGTGRDPTRDDTTGERV